MKTVEKLVQGRVILKKRLLVITTGMLACCPLIGQVTIGDNTKPQEFSILEIVSNGTMGLRLPQLTADERQTLEDSDEFQAQKESKAKGLMIYNLDTDCVDTWAGNQWISKCGTPPLTISISSNPANGEVILNRPITLTAAAAGIEPLTYQWQRNGVNIAGATSATYTVNNMSHDDKGSYTCTVSNEASIAVSNTLPITYTCGAYTTSGEWLQFMCHNLGADESLDPTLPSPGLYGDLYQWGRRTDGHEKRSSPRITGPASGTELDANGQVAESSDKYGKFIVNDTTWRRPILLTLWGNGTLDENPPKTINDPCPEGWKVPSQKQWKSLVGDMHTNDPQPSVATANIWTLTSDGFMIGDALFLPFSTLSGQYGNYHSSSFLPSSVYYSAGLQITSSKIYAMWPSEIARGCSVRCVKE